MTPIPTFGQERNQPPREVLRRRDSEVSFPNDLVLGKVCDAASISDGVQELIGSFRQRGRGKDLPEYLQALVEGSGECGDSYLPFSKPEWLDEEKYRRGQRFALDNVFGLIYCELISLMMLFTFRTGLEALIFTSRSDTPYKAFKRYLSTVTRVMSWYDGDVWAPDSLAHKNMKTVRVMHDAVRRSMNSCARDALRERVECRPVPELVSQHIDIARDLRSTCPVLRAPLACSAPVYVSQCDMAITQFGFCGLVLMFPDMFGIHGASEEELEGFAHFWRTVGYLLGIQDRYNFCEGDLATVRQRGRDMVEHWVRPSFGRITYDWLHMSKCVFVGLNYFLPCSTFELTLLYLLKVLDISAPKLESSLTWVQYCIYQYNVYLYSTLSYFPGFWAFHNWLIYFAIYVFKIVDVWNRVWNHWKAKMSTQSNQTTKTFMNTTIDCNN